MNNRPRAVQNWLTPLQVNPRRHLRHVLERIVDHPSSRIDELLPWAVAAKWADEAQCE